MALYWGIDLGTTGLKSLLVRPDGTIAGSGYREYPILIPSPGYAEQNPEDWWTAIRETLAEAIARSGADTGEIAGVGLSGQMHGMVLTDENDTLLAPAVIWCDQRSVNEVAEIREKAGEKLGQWTQNPVSTGFQACSLVWMRKHRPEIYSRVKHVLLPKDYLRLRLTGLYGTEPTDACSTLLFDCANRTWSMEMLSCLDIDPAILPAVGAGPHIVHGGLCAAAAKELGLKAGIPVVYGGGDQPMQAIGNGILAPGDASVTLGTGGQIFAPMESAAYDSALRTHTFCHADGWYVMGATLNCCLAQNWFFDKVLGSRDFAELHAQAAKVERGSGGLYFLPYLTGERTPHMNPEARGAFIGMTLGHDRPAMVRAAVEGISYAMLDAMNCIAALKPDVNRLILSGGGARSPLWKQIIADMFARPIYTTKMTEEAGTGAAICAMVGAGEYASLEDACAAIVRYDDAVTEPDAAATAFYKEHYKTFQSLYQANKPFFGK